MRFGKLGMAAVAVVSLVSAPVMAQAAEIANQDELKITSRDDQKRLSTKICNQMYIAKMIGKTRELEKDINSIFLSYNGWTTSTPNYKSKIATFINQNID